MQDQEKDLKQTLQDAAAGNAEAGAEQTAGNDGVREDGRPGDGAGHAELIRSLEEENAALRAEAQKLKTETEARLQSLVRTVADERNRARRAQEDVERERRYGIEKFVKALLPIVDSLELALKHAAPGSEGGGALLEGVNNTLALFLKELANFHVEAIDPLGQPFDPNLHQAVSLVPSPDYPENSVFEVLQKGYSLNGRVVRPAMVMVSAGAPRQSGDASRKINLEV